VGGKRHAPAALLPGKGPGIHCTGEWVGARASLDGCGKSCPTGIWFPARSARSVSLYRLRYPGASLLETPPPEHDVWRADRQNKLWTLITYMKSHILKGRPTALLYYRVYECCWSTGNNNWSWIIHLCSKFVLVS